MSHCKIDDLLKCMWTALSHRTQDGHQNFITALSTNNTKTWICTGNPENTRGLQSRLIGTLLAPCSNDYSMLVLCDNPFDIVSVIYGIKNLHKHVLIHLKTYRKYYTLASTTYLSKKKTGFR